MTAEAKEKFLRAIEGRGAAHSIEARGATL